MKEKLADFVFFFKSGGKGGLTRRWLTADYLAEGLHFAASLSILHFWDNFS
jgi:hypothetical protein